MILLLFSANNDGITPVHQAASEGHVQCLKLLIEVGAKLDGRDCRGHTPLDLAKLWGHKKCARYIEQSIQNISVGAQYSQRHSVINQFDRHIMLL